MDYFINTWTILSNLQFIIYKSAWARVAPHHTTSMHPLSLIYLNICLNCNGITARLRHEQKLFKHSEKFYGLFSRNIT